MKVKLRKDNHLRTKLRATNLNAVRMKRKPKLKAKREKLFVIWDKLIGTVEGPSDWSENLDHYLYGTPKREKGNETPKKAVS